MESPSSSLALRASFDVGVSSSKPQTIMLTVTVVVAKAPPSAMALIVKVYVSLIRSKTSPGLTYLVLKVTASESLDPSWSFE